MSDDQRNYRNDNSEQFRTRQDGQQNYHLVPDDLSQRPTPQTIPGSETNYHTPGTAEHASFEKAKHYGTAGDKANAPYNGHIGYSTPNNWGNESYENTVNNALNRVGGQYKAEYGNTYESKAPVNAKHITTKAQLDDFLRTAQESGYPASLVMIGSDKAGTQAYLNGDNLTTLKEASGSKGQIGLVDDKIKNDPALTDAHRAALGYDDPRQANSVATRIFVAKDGPGKPLDQVAHAYGNDQDTSKFLYDNVRPIGQVKEFVGIARDRKIKEEFDKAKAKFSERASKSFGNLGSIFAGGDSPKKGESQAANQSEQSATAAKQPAKSAEKSAEIKSEIADSPDVPFFQEGNENQSEPSEKQSEKQSENGSEKEKPEKTEQTKFEYEHEELQKLLADAHKSGKPVYVSLESHQNNQTTAQSYKQRADAISPLVRENEKNGKSDYLVLHLDADKGLPPEIGQVKDFPITSFPTSYMAAVRTDGNGKLVLVPAYKMDGYRNLEQVRKDIEQTLPTAQQLMKDYNPEVVTNKARAAESKAAEAERSAESKAAAVNKKISQNIDANLNLDEDDIYKFV